MAKKVLKPEPKKVAKGPKGDALAILTEEILKVTQSCSAKDIATATKQGGIVQGAFNAVERALMS